MGWANRVRALSLGLLATSCLAAPALAAPDGGLLFHAPADKDLAATVAGGLAPPLFADKVRLVPGGASGQAIQSDDDQILAWSAPGNLYAQRGTLSFFWRSRTLVGRQPFPIFRAGYPDHTSWDMAFLRIDWNGDGYDAFVTDANLARTRVSFTLPAPPKPDAWTHIAFAWDETRGVQLWVDGKPAARKEATAVYDSGLYAFGPFSRVIAGYQVQSAYNFQRGGDIDEVRVYDHMLGDADVAGLARGQAPVVAAAPARNLADPATRAEWWTRYGFNRPADPPPYLAAPSTRIRKVEFADARDWKARDWKGSDGIRETTWPGVYNRSKLPGRSDYFILPDWNVYAVGGKALTVTLPKEPWNRLEITGAAAGKPTFVDADGRERPIGARATGQERTTLQLGSEMAGGKVRFDNAVQETPIQEIAAYDVAGGAEPAGAPKLAYVIDAKAAADYPTLDELNGWIRGRYLPDERTTVVALPAGAPRRPAAAASGAALPLVHVLIPADFRSVKPGGPVQRFSYGWENMDAGLDGIALDLPALNLAPTHGGLIPLNIRIKDPVWPDRDLLDVNVSVKPGEARTLWLDTRDRMLPNGRSLYLTIAGAGADFDARALDGAKVRLVFKDRAAALPEHIADRQEQVRAGLAFFVEEQPNNRLLPVFERWDREVTDLLRVDPQNRIGRIYWAEQNDEQPTLPFDQPTPPAGVPLWAFRQVEDLKLVQRFVNWWIDERQIPDGEFGGGLSDDTDLLNQWPPLALMGVDPDKVRASQAAMLDAVYANGMLTNGVGTIHADELHSYEEGINGIAQGVALNFGDPQALERAMATARHYGRLTEVNPAGHRHFVSNWFSATDAVREGVWQWQKTPSFLILHPGLLVALYNGDPALKRLMIEMADGYLAHGKPDGKGGLILPTEVYWPTDQDKSLGGTGQGNGAGAVSGLFWAAWRWTGDPKYLAPIKGNGLSGLLSLGPDVLSNLNEVQAQAPAMIATASRPDDYQLSNTGGGGSSVGFARFAAWQATGDKSYLEALYAREIRSGAQRLSMMTEGHLWTDRVQVPSEMLQRSRLGGVAFRRGQIYPGNTVAWRFAAPARATDVAILMPKATPTGFKVLAYNLSDQPVRATLIGSDVASGRWRISQGLDANGDDAADTPQAQTRAFERGEEVTLTLAPHQTTVLEASLEAADPPGPRPDIGLGRGDLKLASGHVAVTVHSLGGAPTPAGRAVLEDASGKALAEAPFPALAAPLDLIPKTGQVRLPIKPGAVRVRLVLDGAPHEITARNNAEDLPKP